MTTLILLGRYLEARAKRAPRRAIRRLLELGARDACVSCATARRCSFPSPSLRVGDLFVVRPGREDRDGRRRRRRRLGRRPVASDRRVGARRRLARLRGRGRDRERPRAARRARDEGRRRHRSRPDRAGSSRPRSPARPRCSASPTASRPSSFRWCWRSRWRPSQAWLARRRGRRRRVHGRGRSADHRLPLRARARDTGGADGRHRPGRPARRADPRPAGAGADAPRRHRRARQDGHDHGGQDGARRA